MHLVGGRQAAGGREAESPMDATIALGRDGGGRKRWEEGREPTREPNLKGHIMAGTR